MAKKGLIIYESHTGNTEKVAMRFKEVFEKRGWECTTFHVTGITDPANPPFDFKDFDFVCVGFPVVEGRNTDYLWRFMFDNPYSGGYRGMNAADWVKDTWAGKGRRPPTQKGIVFATRGGGVGAADLGLENIEHRLRGMNVQCVGKFDCRGELFAWNAVNRVADSWGWVTERASEIIGRYKKDPKHPAFNSLSAEQRKLLDEIAAEDESKDMPGLMHRGERYKGRPNERDLLKAEIFLEEILDDNYGRG